MEVNDNNVQQLAFQLQATLAADPAERKKAEKTLESHEAKPNYSILLLNVIDKSEIPLHLRISASITFKNFIKRNWALTEEGADKIPENDRTIIRQNIVGLMLRSPDKIQKQLSDAISCIGKEDFPQKWPNLMHEMIEKFQTNDFNVIVGILHTGHSIFKRYRHEFKSDKLWKEIKFVLDNFCEPFTELTKKMIELAQANANNPDNLKLVYSSLVLICKIFYSLNFQDLPEFFEDNMAIWMNYFHILLAADPHLLGSDDKDEPGVMEQVKTQVCDNLTMYAQKYDEDFCSHLPGFVNDVWQLLINTGVQAKYDLLVSNAIQFLASVAERNAYKNLFEDPGTLSSICEKVIVPNMEFREADDEAFEENAEEYIRRDIEGSDIDTRRRAACDLVRALSKSFEETVISNFSVYIQHMLQLYQQDPKQNWKSKDAAIFLVTSLAAKAQTQKHGVTQTSQLVNVVDFFTNHIIGELHTADVNVNPVIKADAIKYIMVFRMQLPKASLMMCLPSLIKHLQSSSHVVHSYAACCIEKLLSMKPQIILKADISPLKNELLQNLFQVLQVQGSEENEYIMKAIMRSFHVLEEGIFQHLEAIVPQLLQKLNAVCKNPSKPHFNHFLFESICLCITVSCNVNLEYITLFEGPLFTIFGEILNQDIQEFVPYCFQILSLMLEKHVNSVPDPYMNLFPLLLQPPMWESTGNIPALVRLLQAYISVGHLRNEIFEKLPGMLGVFQKLLASRTNDHYGLQLLNSILVHVPQNLMAQYIQQVFVLLFQKLTTSKTTKYTKGVIVFFSLYIVKYSLTSFVEVVEKIQPRMFGMVVEKLFIADANNVNLSDRKLCAVALTKVLCDPLFIKDDALSPYWVPLLEVTISLLEQTCPQGSLTVEENTDILGVRPSEEFQTAYSQLLYSSRVEPNYCSDVPDAKINLAKSIQMLCLSSQEAKMRLAGLQPDIQKCLQQYMGSAGVTIA